MSDAAVTAVAGTNMITATSFIVLRGGESNRMISLRATYAIKVGRLGNVFLHSLIGQPFDATYSVDEKTRKFVRVSDDMLPDLDAEMLADTVHATATNLDGDAADIGEDAAACLTAAEDDKEGGDAPAHQRPTRDNRNLVDTNSAQRLTTEDIQDMKERDGVTGIVSRLVQHSATFATKTAFAQEKYIKRKKLKYNAVFRVERPSVTTLCELWCPALVRGYSEPEPNKWLRLRIDAIAQMLSLANVTHDSHVMIFERTNGFVCAAVLDRMSGAGRITQVLAPKATPPLLTAEMMGLQQIKERWRAVLLEDVVKHTRGGGKAAKAKTISGVLGDAPEAAADAPLSDAEAPPAPPPTKAPVRGKAKKANQQKPGAGAADGDADADNDDRIRMMLRRGETMQLLRTQPVDGLIIADDEDPEAVLTALVPYLRLSGALCVYSPFAQQLFSLAVRVRDDVVDCKVQETWVREIQVLPNRTHPNVNMSHTGGYLLSGIKVQPLATVRPPKNEAGTRRERDD